MIPTLEELGGMQLYPSDSSVGQGQCSSSIMCPLNIYLLDRRPALRAVLRALLVTYSLLMGSLLVPPPTILGVKPEWERHFEWINILSQNLMAAANDLRPIQVCLIELNFRVNAHHIRQEDTLNR